MWAAAAKVKAPKRWRTAVKWLSGPAGEDPQRQGLAHEQVRADEWGRAGCSQSWGGWEGGVRVPGCIQSLGMDYGGGGGTLEGTKLGSMDFWHL